MQQPLINLSTCKRVLCLGAHADDIEIGCGGTILRIIETVEDLEIYWCVFSAAGPRCDEAQNSADAFLHSTNSTIAIHDFEDGRMPFCGGAVKDTFVSIRDQFAPDLVLTHRLEDRHQDHRLLAELTWQTFRDHLIWEYEIPKYEGDLGQPNLHIRLRTHQAERKLDLLAQHFPSQRDKPWFSRETFESLMRLRAVEAGGKSKYVESFTARKISL